LVSVDSRLWTKQADGRLVEPKRTCVRKRRFLLDSLDVERRLLSHVHVDWLRRRTLRRRGWRRNLGSGGRWSRVGRRLAKFGRRQWRRWIVRRRRWRRMVSLSARCANLWRPAVPVLPRDRANIPLFPTRRPPS